MMESVAQRIAEAPSEVRQPRPAAAPRGYGQPVDGQQGLCSACRTA